MLRTARRTLTAVFGMIVIGGALAACTSQQAAPTPTTAPSETAEPGLPEGAVLRPGQDARANQLFFEKVVQDFYAANGRTGGQAIIDELVASGFVKDDMEVTYDSTEIGLEAASIQFSVRIGEECLFGQMFADSVTTTLTDVTGTGSCMIGQTRPIDW